MAQTATQIGWKEATLGEVAQIKGGKRLPLGANLQKRSNQHPYIKITNVVNNRIEGVDEYVPDEVFPFIQRYIVDAGDIIVSIVGTIGSVAQVPDYLNKANLTENCVKVLPEDDKLHKRFLYYFLISSIGQGEIKKNTVGAVQAKLPIYGVQNISLLLPDVSDQCVIAGVLSAFDDKIDLLRKQSQTLEALAQGLFKEWFVDFNFPNELGKPYKKSGGKMADSELGQVPDGWRLGKLADEFKIIMGQSPKGESYNQDKQGMIFFQGRAEFQERFPEIRLYTTDPKRIAEKFDVLVSVRAPVGDINVAFTKCCIGRGLAAVRSDNKSYVLYKIKYLQNIFQKFEAQGTVFGSIGKDDFAKIEVLIPRKEVIGSFEALTHPIDQKIFNNYIQIQTLSTLRDEFLPRLMRGELRFTKIFQ